jgi:hypothetical protein
MRKTIDDLALQIMGEKVAEDLRKALPPKVAYRLRHWFEYVGPRVRIGGRKKLKQRANQTTKSEAPLRKNQIMAQIGADETIRMDFGADIPESIKKAAMTWAKRRGLKAVEASLQKSADSSSYIIFSKTDAPRQITVVETLVWEL